MAEARIFSMTYGLSTIWNWCQISAQIGKPPEWTLNGELFSDGLRIMEGIPLLHTWLPSRESVTALSGVRIRASYSCPCMSFFAVQKCSVVRGRADNDS